MTAQKLARRRLGLQLFYATVWRQLDTSYSRWYAWMYLVSLGMLSAIPMKLFSSRLFCHRKRRKANVLRRTLNVCRQCADPRRVSIVALQRSAAAAIRCLRSYE